MARVKAFCVVNNTILAGLPASIQVVDSGALVGGYTWIGRVGVWSGLLITTTDAQLTAWDAASGAGCVVIVRIADDNRIELDDNINGAVLTKLNTWLAARGFPTEGTGSNRAIIRKLMRRLQANFEFEQVDIN